MMDGFEGQSEKLYVRCQFFGCTAGEERLDEYLNTAQKVGLHAQTSQEILQD